MRCRQSHASVNSMWFAIEACCGQISVFPPLQRQEKILFSIFNPKIFKFLVSKSSLARSLYVLIHLTAVFNNMRTLKFKPQPTVTFLAAVNQIPGGFRL